jgi:Holliday junction resolvasome RuvABC endonuclease subunit
MATILSLDPGLRNYGYSIIRTDADGGVKVLQSGLIFTTVTQLTVGLVPQFKEHSKTIRTLIGEYGITHLIVERYMSRRMGGITIEAVNVMIGGLLEICTDCQIYFRCLSSAQWKNAVNRVKSDFLEKEYQAGRPEKVTPHTIDATMIGLFAVGLMRNDDPYPLKKLRTGIIVNMVKNSNFVNIGELIKPNRKKRGRK